MYVVSVRLHASRDVTARTSLNCLSVSVARFTYEARRIDFSFLRTLSNLGNFCSSFDLICCFVVIVARAIETVYGKTIDSDESQLPTETTRFLSNGQSC